MIQGKLLSYGDDLQEVLEIRKKVFVEELGEMNDIVSDSMDDEAVHVVVYEPENHPIAAGRLIYGGDSCRIDKLAVLKQFRRKEYGDFAVRMLINRAFLAGIDKIWVDTKQDYIGFFERIGFHVVEIRDNEFVSMVISMIDRKTCCHKI